MFFLKKLLIGIAIVSVIFIAGRIYTSYTITQMNAARAR